MNKNSKFANIATAIITIVFGILVAIFGGQQMFDLYFTILFYIVGAVLAAFAILVLVRNKEMSFQLTFGSAAAFALAIGLTTNYYTLGAVISIIALLIVALGSALALYGVYTLVKGELFNGVGQIVVGALAIVLAVLYMCIPSFADFFWIIVGVLIAIYGVLLLVQELTKGKGK